MTMENILDTEFPYNITREKCDDGFRIEKCVGGVKVFAQNTAAYRRALLILKVCGKKAFTVSSQKNIGMLGVMVDCSRNAVPKISTLMSFIKTVSSLGYNTLMLYTEDTYVVRDEPYFGYFRGAYTTAELRELVDFGEDFGMEIVPCIQTLAHMNQLLRWNVYDDVHDVADILLAGEDKTYKLIDRMLSSLREAFKSVKINIGMDEAHLIGLGRYLDKHGFINRTQILLAHLQRVRALCFKHGFTNPMMWSDMFMRLAFKGFYYDITTPVPEQIQNSVPDNTTLIYWDYFNDDKRIYDELFSRHKIIGKSVCFACSAYKWVGFAPDNTHSIRLNSVAFPSAQANNINDILVTMWGDNGAEASIFSVLPTLINASNLYYGQGNQFDDCLCRALTGIDMNDFCALDSVNHLDSSFNGVSNNSKVYLYNDLLCGLFDSTVEKGYGAIYAENAKKIAAVKDNPYKYIFKTLAALCNVLAVKCELGADIRKNYNDRNIDALQENLAQIGTVKKLLKNLYKEFKFQWFNENKPFGFEVQDVRLGGMILRCDSATETIKSFLSGEIDRIEELEVPLLNPDTAQDGKGAHIYFNDFQKIFSANIM